VFQQAAYGAEPPRRTARPGAVIARAIERRSKPQMAVKLLDAVAARGRNSVPAPLRHAIETCIRLARR
jgi:hypothetical protein